MQARCEHGVYSGLFSPPETNGVTAKAVTSCDMSVYRKRWEPRDVSARAGHQQKEKEKEKEKKGKRPSTLLLQTVTQASTVPNIPTSATYNVTLVSAP